MEQSITPRKWLPRDAAGKMDFPPENGAIKRVVGFEEYMEIYAVRATYRVRTPDNLDPARTVPNMPWSNSANATVGASNPIARIIIQSVEALGNWPLRNGDPKIIKRSLHACKEETLACEAAYIHPHADHAEIPFHTFAILHTSAPAEPLDGMVYCFRCGTLHDKSSFCHLPPAKRPLKKKHRKPNAEHLNPPRPRPGNG